MLVESLNRARRVPPPVRPAGTSFWKEHQAHSTGGPVFVLANWPRHPDRIECLGKHLPAFGRVVLQIDRTVLLTAHIGEKVRSWDHPRLDMLALRIPATSSWVGVRGVVAMLPLSRLALAINGIRSAFM